MPDVPNCSECEKGSTPKYGFDNKELCKTLKDFHYKMANFKRNLLPVPSNKIGLKFLEIFNESLKWYVENGPRNHITWWMKTILTYICLQIKDPKVKTKLNTLSLKGRLVKIESGQIGQVMRECLHTRIKSCFEDPHSWNA